MNIFITSASSNKGMGHLSRTISIASYLKKKDNILYIDDKTNLKNISSEFETIVVEKKNDEIIKSIKFYIGKNSKKKNIIFIDDYELPINFIRKLNLLNSVVVEHIPLKRENKLVSDISICLSNTKINRNDKILLSGEKYFVLNKNLKKISKITYQNKEELFIFLGGGTDKNIIQNIIQNIYDLNIDIGVYSTFMNPLNKLNIKVIRNFNKLKKSKIKYFIDSKDFMKKLSSSKLAILAPGLTFFEASYFKISSLLISLNNKQHNHLKSFDYYKDIDLGNFRKINFEKLRKKILQVFRGKKQPAFNQNAFDGNGFKRINYYINKFYE